MRNYWPALALSLFATTASAQPLRIDWLALTANAGGHTADVWSTQRFLHNGSGCVEANPRLGPHPSFRTIASTAALSFGVTTGVQLGVTWLGNHARTSRGRAIAKWSARGFGYGMGAVRAKSAIRGVVLCPGRENR